MQSALTEYCFFRENYKKRENFFKIDKKRENTANAGNNISTPVEMVGEHVTSGESPVGINVRRPNSQQSGCEGRNIPHPNTANARHEIITPVSYRLLSPSRFIAQGPDWYKAQNSYRTLYKQSPPPSKRQRPLQVQQRFDQLLHQDLASCRSLYKCFSSVSPAEPLINPDGAEDEKPSSECPIRVFIFLRAPSDINRNRNLFRMDEHCDWPSSMLPPMLSAGVVVEFLARVHAYTAVGLETQATAYSYLQDGIIKYLAFMPQINNVSSVEDRSSDLSGFDAINCFPRMAAENGVTYVSRCWLHTHPPFVSCRHFSALHELSKLQRFLRNSFFSKKEGDKVIMCAFDESWSVRNKTVLLRLYRNEKCRFIKCRCYSAVLCSGSHK